jgi:hypothetical protein
MAKYLEVVRECSGSQPPMANVTEYLEQLLASGIEPADRPVVQPLYAPHLAAAGRRRRPRPARRRCYRYWSQGIWTGYGAELVRRATEIVTHLDT